MLLNFESISRNYDVEEGGWIGVVFGNTCVKSTHFETKNF